MMNFEVISDKPYAVKDAGYALDFSHGYYEHNSDYYNGRQTAPSNDVDSFYDLDGAALCKGEDGNLYAVEYKHTDGGMVPAIWQRVCKV